MSKLTALLIIIIILLVMLLLSMLVGATPITFVNSWTRTVSDGGGLLPETTTITVATGSGNGIAVFMHGFDADASANINYTITDNAAPANTYTFIAQRKVGNLGTVDDQVHTWIALSARPTTTISITRTGGTANSHNAVAIIVQSYANVVSLGNVATSVPNTAFPDMFITASTNISWVAGFIHFYSNPTPYPPGGYNAGRFVATVDTGLTSLHNLGMDNNITDNGTNGGNSHVCTITQYCIFPNEGNSVLQYFTIFEMIPQTSPTAITLPADNIQMDSARLNGNLTDMGIASTVNIWFSWGDTVSLGNNTTTASSTTIKFYSFTIGGLVNNHTYYFIFHAENAANSSQFSNGTVLSFTTTINFTAIQFGNYGWVFGFIGALILGLWGAHWIKRKREER